MELQASIPVFVFDCGAASMLDVNVDKASGGVAVSSSAD